MNKLLISMLLLSVIIGTTTSAFTIIIPTQECFGFATYCDAFSNMHDTCLKQSGCSWIGGNPYGKCVGQHIPCYFYHSYNLCEQNIFCEWRGN